MANRTVMVSAATRNDEGTPRVRLNASYVAALENAGLVPLIVPPLASSGEAGEVVAHAGGILLTGGGDLDPALYGQPLHPKAHPPQSDRDRTELALVAEARARRVPMLAICRGIQVVNVALGGTLVQDIPSERPDALDHDARSSGADIGAQRERRTHEVNIEPGSRLAEALGATRIAVNSFHHQAVDKIAPGLRVTAQSPDGIVEGLETADDWWMLGVQWHPEEMDQTEEPWDRGLFAAFARMVARKGGAG